MTQSVKCFVDAAIYFYVDKWLHILTLLEALDYCCNGLHIGLTWHVVIEQQATVNWKTNTLFENA